MIKDKAIEPPPRWLIPLILVLFAFIIYGNCIRNGYSLDDVIVTVVHSNNNTRIEKGISGIPALFSSRYFDAKQQNYGYRPLSLSTFAIEYQFFKKDPHISHLINLLIYALTCVLLFFILSNLFSGYLNILPLLITLLFIAHPLHTEVVDSIKNRDELMVFLFGLSSLYFALKYFDNKKIAYVLLSVLFLWFAYLSKETAIIFLPIIPVTIYFFKPVKLSRISFAIIILIIAYVLFVVVRRILLQSASPIIRPFIFTENPLYYVRPFMHRFIPALYIIWYYLKLFIIPYPLSCYYGYDTIPIANLGNPFVWISFLIYLGLAVYALLNLKKKDILSFGILIYLIGILPFSNLYKPAPGIVAERFAYTASLGFCIIVAIILLRIFKIPFQAKTIIRKFKPQFIIVIVAILGLYSVLTISRNNDWKDVSTLYRRDVEHFDKSYNLHYLLVTNITSQINSTAPGQLRDKLLNELREHQLKIAEIVSKDIAKYPKDYISRNNLASIYVNYTDEQEEARKLLRQAIAVKPDYSEAYYNIAYSYEKSNNIDSAIYFYNKTLDMESSFVNIYLKLPDLYTGKGEYSKAFEIDERAMKMFPDDAGFYINAGNTCMLMKDTLKGINYFVKAVDIEPSNINMRTQIVNFLKKAGYTDKAKQMESK